LFLQTLIFVQKAIFLPLSAFKRRFCRKWSV
jgi:hypothetical protein